MSRLKGEKWVRRLIRADAESLPPQLNAQTKRCWCGGYQLLAKKTRRTQGPDRGVQCFSSRRLAERHAKDAAEGARKTAAYYREKYNSFRPVVTRGTCVTPETWRRYSRRTKALRREMARRVRKARKGK